MSLVGSSLYRGRRSTTRNNVKIKLWVEFVAGVPVVVLYTGASVVFVDSNNVIVIDIPSTFNNLSNLSSNPFNTNTPTTLISEVATFSGGDHVNVSWFPVITGTPPPQSAQHTRVWFVLQTQAGASVLPEGGIVFTELTLTDSKLVPQQLT